MTAGLEATEVMGPLEPVEGAEETFWEKVGCERAIFKILFQLGSCGETTEARRLHDAHSNDRLLFMVCTNTRPGAFAVMHLLHAYYRTHTIWQVSFCRVGNLLLEIRAVYVILVAVG